MIEKIQQSELKYSPQAVLLLSSVKEIDFEAFEKFAKESFVVSGSIVIDFLAQRQQVIDNQIRQITDIPNV
jgi:hypothetical protein